tara:strand:- start:374 stop:589 length:216 start_codon:yes stop_codon:yes gene_type:complete
MYIKMNVRKRRDRGIREIDYEIKRHIAQKRVLVSIQLVLPPSSAIIIDGVLMMIEERIIELEQEIRLPPKR